MTADGGLAPRTVADQLWNCAILMLITLSERLGHRAMKVPGQDGRIIHTVEEQHRAQVLTLNGASLIWDYLMEAKF